MIDYKDNLFCRTTEKFDNFEDLIKFLKVKLRDCWDITTYNIFVKTLLLPKSMFGADLSKKHYVIPQSNESDCILFVSNIILNLHQSSYHPIIDRSIRVADLEKHIEEIKKFLSSDKHELDFFCF